MYRRGGCVQCTQVGPSQSCLGGVRTKSCGQSVTVTGRFSSNKRQEAPEQRLFAER